MNTRVTLTIAAPIARVWRALTDPVVVAQWSQLAPDVVPDGYPAASQHATWLDGDAVLHDYIIEVEAERRLVSRLTFVDATVDETYTLEPTDDGSTILDGAWTGDPELADNRAAMGRLKEWCEG